MASILRRGRDRRRPGRLDRRDDPVARAAAGRSCSSARSSRASTSASRCSPSRCRSSSGSACTRRSGPPGSRRSTARSSGTRPTARRGRSSSPRRATRITMAYQVKRAEFDELLLRHAASCGAEVREETSPSRTCSSRGPRGRRPRRGAAAGRRGREEHPRPRRRRRLGPGRRSLAQARTAELRPEAEARRALRALRRHRAGPRAAGRATSSCPSTRASGTGSSRSRTARAASAACSIRRRSASPRASRSRRGTTSCSPARRACGAPARRPPRLEGPRRLGLLRRSRTLGGDGWVLVGDAATFLDPVFSTGVFLAMATGERAAAAIDRALARRGRVDARDFRAYERQRGRMYAPVPEVRLQLLRPGVLRGVLHAESSGGDPRGGRHDARRRRRARLSRDAGSGRS